MNEFKVRCSHVEDCMNDKCQHGRGIYEQGVWIMSINHNNHTSDWMSFSFNCEFGRACVVVTKVPINTGQCESIW